MQKKIIRSITLSDFASLLA